MCTTDARWPIAVMKKLTDAIGASATIPDAEGELVKAKPNEIQVVKGSAQATVGSIRFSGLVWSPLFAKMKEQLSYDITGKETNCTTDDTCKPKRASLNGSIKDKLLNDCLSDALAYQGVARKAFRHAMVESLTKVVQDAGDSTGPVVVVAASLGSKMVFDALTDMLNSPKDPSQIAAAKSIQRRLAVVFMAANQIPILALADQDLPSTREKSAFGGDSSAGDSLKIFLQARQQNANKAGGVRSRAFTELAIVAFNDPNDLLSYRLLPTRYKADQVRITDVLVSNGKTYLGLFEDPLSAHGEYLTNDSVMRLLACGAPSKERCLK